MKASGVIAIFYCGLIVGVSFFATSIKFLAETPSRGQLLEVGRVTFSGFMWVEFVVAGALAAAGWLMVGSARRKGAIKAIALGVGAVVLVQHLGLRPALDERVSAAMEGRTLAASSVHLVYGVLEVAKLLAVATVAALSFRNTQRQSE